MPSDLKVSDRFLNLVLLLEHLSALFAVFVRGSMDIEVPSPGLEVCCLGFRQRYIAFDWACEITGNRHHRRRIGVGRSWPMKVSGRGRTGQAGIGDRPGQFLRGGA